MTNIIDVAKKTLLEPTHLSEQDLSQVFGQLLGQEIDYADLYFQSIYAESWHLEDQIVKDGTYDFDQGVGVRANAKEKTGFAYSDELVLPALTEAASAARSIARSGQHQRIKAWHAEDAKALYPSQNPLHSLSENEKIALLKRADEVARKADSRVVHVSASLSGSYETVLIADSEGMLHADVRPLVRMGVSVILEAHGQRERGHSGGGLRGDYSYFVDENRVDHFAKEAVRLAALGFEAKAAPAGHMPVVLGPGWPGVLLHEAVGHGLEGDFNRKGSSAFSGRLGQRVASPLCTIVDDGTIANRRGSLNVDDEGVETARTVLIENGILKNYMQDKLNARLMKMKPTGNGRRESYAHVPMPRMTNTFMLAGQDDPEDIIKSVDKGIYAVNFDGGQVDITSGKFVFSASEAYLIEKGKITAPIKGATLIGNGPDVLTKVSMVGHDMALDEGVGVCGKDGQSVPVGVGQPTLKVDELTVGGTAK
ncbi:MAG: metalloprotease TldD [Gammaproteobacteria bacterium]